MPNNDLEVFDYLLANGGSPKEIDYLTYAVFAYKKKAWCEHFEKAKGHAPTRKEIDDWISQLSQYEFDQIRDDAAVFFHNAAVEHLRDFVEGEKKNAVNSSILSTIKEYTSPWRHLTIAFIMALLAPIALGGVIFLFGLFDKNFPIHVTFERVVAEPHSASPSGH